MTANKCLTCGTEHAERIPRCMGCGAELDGPLCLLASNGRRYVLRIDLRVNRAWARPLGEDHRLWDADWQMQFRRQGSGWCVVPNPSARHDTLLNGAQLHVPTPLNLGDVLAVGRAAVNIARTPLTVVSPTSA